MKDRAMALAIKSKLNERFSEYGQITACTLNTRTNVLAVEAHLRGEKEPVRVTLKHYEIQAAGSQHYVVLRQFSSSRAWVATLLTALFSGKRYKIPSVLSKLL